MYWYEICLIISTSSFLELCENDLFSRFGDESTLLTGLMSSYSVLIGQVSTLLSGIVFDPYIYIYIYIYSYYTLNKTCHRGRIARLTAPCPSHKKL